MIFLAQRENLVMTVEHVFARQMLKDPNVKNAYRIITDFLNVKVYRNSLNH